MIKNKAPAKRRRLGAHGMIFRRRRVFARLREGFTYDEIASEEGVSSARVRQIVSEELQKRAVDSGADHAKLQLDRLAPGGATRRRGDRRRDISAITLISRRPTGSTAISRSPGPIRSMTTKRARSSSPRSTVSPRTWAWTK